MTSEPSTKRGRRSRERIVAAADGVVAERGVEGASLDEILAKATASKSQLYHYFSSKDDLVHAVIARRRERHLGLQRPLLVKLDTWEAIAEWFRMAIEMQEAEGYSGCPIGTLANELAGRDEVAREQLDDCFREWQGYLADGLERMRARGELVESADPKSLATGAFAAMQGGLLLTKTNRDATPLRVALDAALSHLRTFAAASGRRIAPVDRKGLSS